MERNCISEGSIARLLLAISGEATAALSPSGISAAPFHEAEEALPYPYYEEECDAGDHGDSYSASISFALGGEGRALSAFEGRWMGAELAALCILPSGEMRLFRGLSMSRKARSGDSPAGFNGREYILSGISWEEGMWIETLL